MSCRWSYHIDFCTSGSADKECKDVLSHGIGLVQHVGERKLRFTSLDRMIVPITHTFNNYKIGTDIEKYLLNPLIKGLQEISGQSQCSKVFPYFPIAIRNFISKINKT